MLQETTEWAGQRELLAGLPAGPAAPRLGSATPVPQHSRPARTGHPASTHSQTNRSLSHGALCNLCIYCHYCHSDLYRQQPEPPSPNQGFDLLFLFCRNFCSKIHYNQHGTDWQGTAKRALRNIRMNLNWDKDIYFTTLSLTHRLSPIKWSKRKALSHTRSTGVKLCIQS